MQPQIGVSKKNFSVIFTCYTKTTTHRFYSATLLSFNFKKVPSYSCKNIQNSLFSEHETFASECIKIYIKWPKSEVKKAPLKNFIQGIIFLMGAQTLFIGRHSLTFSTKTPIQVSFSFFFSLVCLTSWITYFSVCLKPYSFSLSKLENSELKEVSIDGKLESFIVCC